MRLGLGLGLNMQRSGGGFSPLSLFAGGEDGAWFEARSGVLQAPNGEPEASETADPVGLALDRKEGAEFSGGAFSGLGVEAHADPSFDDGTDWNQAGDWVVSGGGATIVNPSAGFSLRAFVNNLVVGRTYLAEVTIGADASAIGFLLRDSDAGVNYGPFTGVGAHTVIVTASGTSALQIRPGAIQTGTLTLASFSVQPISGLHAVQATIASRPTMRAGPYFEDDGMGDSLSWTAPAGTYTVARVNSSGTVTIQTGQALSGATDIMLESTIAGYVAIDRTLTAQETADLTAYMEGL